jgi:hypothetical protein
MKISSDTLYSEQDITLFLIIGGRHSKTALA